MYPNGQCVLLLQHSLPDLGQLLVVGDHQDVGPRVLGHVPTYTTEHLLKGHSHEIRRIDE